MVFPRPEWEKFRERIAQLPMSAQWWKRIFLGSGGCGHGRHGRVLVSPELRAAAGLTRDAMLLGMGEHFELWDKATTRPRKPRRCRSPCLRRFRTLRFEGQAVNTWLQPRSCSTKRSMPWSPMRRPLRRCPSGAAGTTAAISGWRLGATAFDKDPRRWPRRRIADARFAFATRVSPAGRVATRQCGRDLDGSGDQLAADRQPRAGFLSCRRPAGHAHGPTRARGAADWLAQQQQIAEVIRDYGEERFAVAIAKAIVARREKGHPVARTQFAELVAGAVRTRSRGGTQRPRTFRLFGFSSTPSLKSSSRR
jgi:MraZ protein